MSPLPHQNASTDAVLDIAHLSVALPAGADRAQAVQAVSLQVRRGEMLCLVGESGSGKSVVAQAVMGLLPRQLPIADGRIALLGEDITRTSASRLAALRGTHMAMVFQEPMTALNPVMRCGVQVDEILAWHRRLPRAERRERVLAMFERVGLPDPQRIYQAYPHQLSGGQRQRIVIAIALILKPALLICDEPTTALDVTTQAAILQLIRELQADIGTATLFITHDFGVVADIADRVAVMQAGQIVEQGRADDVLRTPQAAYTRMLLAAVPTLRTGTRPPVADGEPLLRAEGIAKRYQVGTWLRRRTVDAAQDFDISLRPGETVAIVGESGSGKSTVARCIARLVEPTHGTVYIDGQPIGRDRAALTRLRRTVQVVFQDPYRSLNPRRSVGDAIIEGLLNAGMPRAQAWQRAADLMALVRLDPAALRRYPAEFSGGQRQRICLARALACEPRVLIADEAVSALDVSVQAQILTLLESIQQRLRIAILFITHDLRVASRICDRVLVMQGGHIVESGSAADVFTTPRHPYTRALLAAAPGRDYVFGAGPDRDLDAARPLPTHAFSTEPPTP